MPRRLSTFHLSTFFLAALPLIATMPVPLCSGQGVQIDASKQASADARFDDLATQYQTLLRAFAADKDQKNELKWFLEKHPRNTMVGDFLTLEQESRGTKVGFSCLLHLVAVGDEIADSEMTKGKTAALRILGKHYQDYPDVDTAFQFVFYGPSAPDSKAFYRTLINSSKRGHVRANAMYKLANMLATESNMLQSQLTSLERAEQKDESQSPQMEAFITHTKKVAERNRTEAISLIKQIQVDHPEELVPAAIEGKGLPRVVAVNRSDFDEVLKSKRKRVVDLLSAVRFELDHSIGQPAPPIDDNDATGKPMKLADYQGKVVVLMFSFKGCAPCEAMYPHNRKLIDELSEEQFVFVGVQGDETRETVQESLESGVITWRVWWDGKDKEISNQWNIRGWPSNFVLDQRGVIRFRDVYGKDLETAVRSLLKKETQ